jgi:hypothetical protein
MIDATREISRRSRTSVRRLSIYLLAMTGLATGCAGAAFNAQLEPRRTITFENSSPEAVQILANCGGTMLRLGRADPLTKVELPIRGLPESVYCRLVAQRNLHGIGGGVPYLGDALILSDLTSLNWRFSGSVLMPSGPIGRR